MLPFLINISSANDPTSLEEYREYRVLSLSDSLVLRTENQIVDHEPISINGNEDFHLQAATNGWSGNGSLNDPFIIEQYSIDGLETSRSCIHIENVDLHFVIRNCKISRASSYGMLIESSNNGIFTNISVTSNGINGIWLNRCQNSTIFENSLYFNGELGIRLLNCFNVSVTGNIAAGNGIGISHEYSSFSNISFNVFSNNTPDQSSFWYPGGIKLYRSNNNMISYNSVSNNNGYGIGLIDSRYNTIFKNNFVSNNDGSTQAFDGQVQTGIQGSLVIVLEQLNNFSYNHWNDWIAPDVDNNGIVDQPYDIDGPTGGNTDLYPLVNPVIISISNSYPNGTFGWTFPSLVAVMIVGVLIRMKKEN